MTASASYTYSDWKLDVPATPYNDNLRGGGSETENQETDIDKEEVHVARSSMH